MALHFVVDDLGDGDQIELTGSEAHHAAAVRRVKPAEPVSVTDGRGGWVDGEVVAAHPREVTIAVRRRSLVPPPARRITLIQALAKGDRDEMAIQAATELGVDEIVPWQSARSVSRWEGAKAAKGVARWQSIVREAAKQAHRAWIPQVRDVVRLSDLLASNAPQIVVLDPWAEQRLTQLDIDGDISLLVGPEGGITPEELRDLVTAGASAVRLGETVLRTSTAGPAAVSALSVALGRW